MAKDLFKAIYGEFLGSTTSGYLEPILTGGLHNTQAPQDTDYPYAIFYQISDVPHWTFDATMENHLVQFTIYDDHVGVETICDLYEGLTKTYDWCSLTISNYDSIYFKREFSNLDKSEGIFTYHVQYRAELQKST